MLIAKRTGQIGEPLSPLDAMRGRGRLFRQYKVYDRYRGLDKWIGSAWAFNQREAIYVYRLQSQGKW